MIPIISCFAVGLSRVISTMLEMPLVLSASGHSILIWLWVTICYKQTRRDRHPPACWLFVVVPAWKGLLPWSSLSLLRLFLVFQSVFLSAAACCLLLLLVVLLWWFLLLLLLLVVVLLLCFGDCPAVQAPFWTIRSCRFYLDRSGQEFGPFRTDKMRSWSGGQGWISASWMWLGTIIRLHGVTSI